MSEEQTVIRINRIMKEARANYEREVNLYAEIRRILAEKFTGKRVDTKHTINYIQKVKPTWTASFQGVSNHVNLRVWGGDSGYKDWNDYGRIMLGYTNELYNFDPALMDKHNMSIENAKHELARIEEFLNSSAYIDLLAKAIDNFNSMRERLLNDLGGCPEHYALKKLAGLEREY